NGNARTTVNVGNATNGLQDIRGPLNITNVPSYTQLNVDDTADLVGQSAVLSANNVTGTIHNLAPADITYETTYADVSGLTIRASNGGPNTFCILSTYSNTPVTLYTGRQGDTINIGNSGNGLSAIQSTVNLVNATLSDTIGLINRNGPGDRYNVNVGNVTDA